MTTEKYNDGEVGSLIWISLILGGVLLAVDFLYSAWNSMPEFWRIIGYVANGACAVLIAIIFAEWKDPNYDKYRVIFCVLAVLTIAYVAGFKAFSNENQSVIDDSNAAKHAFIESGNGISPFRTIVLNKYVDCSIQLLTKQEQKCVNELILKGYPKQNILVLR